MQRFIEKLNSPSTPKEVESLKRADEVFNLENEILKIKNRITTMENYLKEHPDDFSVELSLANLKSRHSELSLKLSYVSGIIKKS